MSDFIVIDKKAAQSFVHEMNHLSWELVPKEILGMQITLRDGRKETIGGLIEQAKKRTEKMGNYIRLALDKEGECHE